MLILLVAYVAKYHWGIQTTCNNFLQLSKLKQGSAISVVKGTYIEFEGTPLQGTPCVNLLHSFGACFITIPLRVCIYISTTYQDFCFCQLNKKWKYRIKSCFPQCLCVVVVNKETRRNQPVKRFLFGLQQDRNYETNMWTLGQCWFNVFIWTFSIYIFLRWTIFGNYKELPQIQRTNEWK